MPTNQPIKILFLTANPANTGRLRLDQEVRAIRERLEVAEHRGRFILEQEWAVRASDIQGYLLHHKPNVVHFSGHGSEAGEILMEGDSPEGQPVPLTAVAALFRILKGNISCVVLNACFTRPQATAIAQTIDCVIGMAGVMDDAAAISFSAAFYQGLGYGQSIRTAFNLGCNQLALLGLEQKDVPELYVGPGVEPDKLSLVNTPADSQPRLVVDHSYAVKLDSTGAPEVSPNCQGPQPTRARRLARSEIFISYSRTDSRWLETLKLGLKPLEQSGKLIVWDASNIKPGELWHAEIVQAINRARVAVLLVSPEFLASDFIINNELPPLLEAAAMKGLTIFWIAIRPSLFEETALGKYKAANDPRRPLACLTVAQRNEQVVQICKKILDATRQTELQTLGGNRLDAAMN